MATLWEKQNARRLRRLALALVAVGLAWRLARYLLAFPVWGDEAMLLVNYFTRGYRDLLGPIDNCQIAPLLFHAAELTALRWLGSSEWAVRLPTFLACLGSVGLFWRLARLSLPPLGRTLAVAIFSVSIWPATMGALTKPYAFDLFFSLALLVPALGWLRRPGRLTPLVLLVVVTPLAVASSYPSVFIAGAIALVLAPTAWQQRRLVVLALFGLFAVLLVGTFVAHYVFVSVPHLASSTHSTTTAAGMALYWKDGFPPAELVPLVRWLVLAHTGQMAAYPLGSANGGSVLTVGLAFVGMLWLWRNRQCRLVVLTLAAFGLWFLAGALRKYPYGASCRLAQHVAPFYCLLAGLGGAALILRWQEARTRWRATLAALALLALIGLGGAMRDVWKPYRDDEALWGRHVTTTLMDRAGADPVLAPHRPQHLNPILAWYLGRHGERVSWAAGIDRLAPPRPASSVWVFCCGLPADESAALEARLAASGGRWRCVKRLPFILMPGEPRERFQHARLYHLVREGG